MIFPGIQPPKTITTRPTLSISIVNEEHLYILRYEAGQELFVLAILCKQVLDGHMSRLNATRLAFQMNDGAEMARSLSKMVLAARSV